MESHAIDIHTHAHPHEHVAHHFDDAVQQRESAELGMWAFLITEVMFFGGLILAYTVYRTQNEKLFELASHELNIPIGAINTAVLLTSSLTMALAVYAAQQGNRKNVITCLALTMLLGSAFLGVKAWEYAEKFHHHLVPFFGLPFDDHHLLPDGAEMFFVLYFFMTGVHALHMVIGIGVLAWLLVAAVVSKGPPRSTPIDMTGLYWHFVDIVWIFLFPFLYLIRPEGVWELF